MKSPFEAYVSKVMTMADNTIRIQLDTQEMSAEKMSELFQLKGKLGWAFIKDDYITPEETEIPLTAPKARSGERTQSQRLRAALFKVWETSGIPVDFEIYYQEQMEHIINKVKNMFL